jgi:hypothetical protein
VLVWFARSANASGAPSVLVIAPETPGARTTEDLENVMATTVETTTTTHWSGTDEQFFRVAAELFSPTFLWGAGALLASYDPDPSPAGTVVTADQAALQSAPASSSVTA